MSTTPDFFRDFGIILFGTAPPRGRVRSYLPWGHVIGQYVAMILILGFGLAVAALFAFTLPFPRPVNVLIGLGVFAGAAGLAYLVGHRDYVWVELDGDTIRAKHLYSQRVIERSVAEIDDLLTLVIQIRTLATVVTEAWLGRIRGMEIRFKDRRTPLRVMRSDPAMRNAKELIEAIAYRMSQIGPVDAEMIDRDGQPMIRRIYWKL
jgi:hypothetical protein